MFWFASLILFSFLCQNKGDQDFKVQLIIQDAEQRHQFLKEIIAHIHSLLFRCHKEVLG